MSDETIWIKRARAGDQEAFARLIETYQTPIYNLTYRMLGDAAEADDAAQEAFLRAYTRLSTYDSRRSFKTWLFSIASHYCIDLLRRRRLTWLSLDEPLPSIYVAALAEPNPGPEEQTVRGEQTALIQRHLARLSLEDRAAIVMRYWYDLSYEEIAEVCGGTVSAIKSRLHRARLALAEALVDERRDASRRDVPSERLHPPERLYRMEAMR
ncbi:MAG: sigma-70 family RNA polymerase sigma factor [Chloroflexi bacterium]|nr:sigma-70 family RNA polymerase sigma factor [Chloroflexota bacterium]MBI3763732.1 sigma-70 family RNA polymerase sigma factor [Chloroflexota bacterium]